MKNIIQIAKIYTISSIFLGPLIFILGYGFTSGGGDYCDSSYYLADGTFSVLREQQFRNAEIFQTIGASFMIIVGLTIFALLLNGRKHERTDMKIQILLYLGTLLMILGYVLVILLSGKSGQSC